METRICCGCKDEKDIDDFYIKREKNHIGRQSYCKKCHDRNQHERRKERKRQAIFLLGGKCQKCGYDRCIAALDFHHLDPSKKEGSSDKMFIMAWAKVIEELKKCVLLCSNCHREEHASDDLFRIKPERNTDTLLKTQLLPTGTCLECGIEVYGTKYCSVECASVGNRKVKRPSKEQLEAELASMSWMAIGRKYGVRDNSVRKWAEQYGIRPRRLTEKIRISEVRDRGATPPEAAMGV